MGHHRSRASHQLRTLALSLAACGCSNVGSVSPVPPAPSGPAPAPTLLTTTDEPPEDPTERARTPSAGLEPTQGVGSVARAADYSLRLVSVRECVTKRHFEPKPGNIKLGVEVVFENSSSEDVRVNLFYANLTDADGVEYLTTFGGCQPELGAVLIASGEKTGGWITFEIPAGARGLRLTYRPIVIGKRDEPLVFDLGR
jgi:hypothetical protein